MKLFEKIAMTLAITLGASAIAAITGVALILVPQYEAMDRNTAVSTALRARAALQREATALATSVSDWANWDDTFTYATRLNPDYVENNLSPNALETIHVDELIIADLKGEVVRSHKAQVDVNVALPSLATSGRIPTALWPEQSELTPRNKISAVVETDFGPAIIAMSRITDSRYQQVADKALILVRRVDAALVSDLQRQSDTTFLLEPLRTNRLVISSNNGYRASVPLATYTSRLGLQVSVDTPATLSDLARYTITIAALLLLFISILACVVLVIFIRRSVTGPLEEMIRHSQIVSTTADLDRRLNFNRTDEIGALAAAHDTMLAQLKQARIQLQEMSYAAGTSTLAADMLHNLRNTLAPIGTALFKGREAIRAMHADKLMRAASEITDPNQPSERKAKLGAYVDAAAREVNELRLEADRQLAIVQDFSGQIESVMNHYEGISRGFKASEAVSVADIFDTAQKVIQGTAALPVSIAITSDVLKIPPVLAERVILRQIIENISVNAVQALHAKGESGTITLAAAEDDHHVEITVTDTGAGIEPHNLTRIFSRGVSTKEGRNRGVGLHYCATALRAMNGKISAESAGAGRGATFRIQLPKAGKQGAIAS
jgi:signal transduction histidine kinase